MKDVASSVKSQLQSEPFSVAGQQIKYGCIPKSSVSYLFIFITLGLKCIDLLDAAAGLGDSLHTNTHEFICGTHTLNVIHSSMKIRGLQGLKMTLWCGRPL